MSLLDDHVVGGDDRETWALVDDPIEEAPLWWPDHDEPDRPGRT